MDSELPQRESTEGTEKHHRTQKHAQKGIRKDIQRDREQETIITIWVEQKIFRKKQHKDLVVSKDYTIFAS